ncbi:MAG: hypothetical protein ACOCSD_02070 [Halolamina sp.]
MVSSTMISASTTRIGGVLARHPRLVVGLVAVLLLLAVQDGAVATDGSVMEPTAEANVDMGPDPDDD